jgi:phosphate starvation-inducible PhoH-like protein
MSSKKSGKKAKALLQEIGSAHKITEKFSLPGICITGKNEGQKRAIELIEKYDVSVLYGVPGSGKTHIALVMGLIMMLQGKYDRLLLTRPYVEAGERLGYLPGDYAHKIAPFMQPLMEISNEYLGKNAIVEFIDKGNIQIMPLAYMRGMTFKNSYVVADEMQNATIQQMRMLLTRIGDRSKLIITGDTEQSDLYTRGEKNGLLDVVDRVKGKISEVGFYEMLEEHCVRSPLVAKIDKLYRQQ